VEGTVREMKKRVRVVASSYRAIDRSVTKWIVVTMVEWSSEVRWELVPKRCVSLTSYKLQYILTMPFLTKCMFRISRMAAFCIS